jgi:predicted phosphodiesterase
MRYGILADVHGNLDALEIALATLRDGGADRFLCAGDLVGYGAHPNECVELVASIGAVCVAGNHDLIAIERLSADTAGTRARVSLEWTTKALGADTRAFLAALPLRADVGRDVVMAHGSLDDPREYTRNGRRAARQLERLATHRSDARLLVLGHTHRAAAWRSTGQRCRPARDGSVTLNMSERYVLNPGGAGHSRERTLRSRCVLLDTDARVATFYALMYDVDAARHGLARARLPLDSYHQPGSPVRTGLRRVRRVPRRAGRALARRRLQGPAE